MVADLMGVLRQSADYSLKAFAYSSDAIPTSTPVENKPQTKETAAILASVCVEIIDIRKDINAVTAIIAIETGVNRLPFSEDLKAQNAAAKANTTRTGSINCVTNIEIKTAISTPI